MFSAKRQKHVWQLEQGLIKGRYIHSRRRKINKRKDNKTIWEYLKVLNWDFTAKHKEALLKFYELAYNNGLIDKMPKIEFVEVE